MVFVLWVKILNKKVFNIFKNILKKFVGFNGFIKYEPTHLNGH